MRTAAQLVAGGALTALVTALAGGLSPTVGALVLGVWTAVIATAQNGLEAAGKIPTLLPTPGLVPSVAPLASKTVATVETAVDQTGGAVGEIEGTVTGTGGELVGEVVDVDAATPPAGGVADVEPKPASTTQ